MTKGEFVQGMRRLEVLYRQEYSREEVEAIYEELKTWELDRFQVVCDRAKEKIFDLPKLSHFLSIASGLVLSSLPDEEEPRKDRTPEEIEVSTFNRVKALAAYWYWVLDDPNTGPALAKKARNCLANYEKEGHNRALIAAKEFCDTVMKKEAPYKPKSGSDLVELEKKRRAATKMKERILSEDCEPTRLTFKRKE